MQSYQKVHIFLYINDKKARKTAISKYHQPRQILKNQFNGENKIHATNISQTWVIKKK